MNTVIYGVTWWQMADKTWWQRMATSHDDKWQQKLKVADDMMIDGNKQWQWLIVMDGGVYWQRQFMETINRYDQWRRSTPAVGGYNQCLYLEIGRCAQYWNVSVYVDCFFAAPILLQHLCKSHCILSSSFRPITFVCTLKSWNDLIG